MVATLHVDVHKFQSCAHLLDGNAYVAGRCRTTGLLRFFSTMSRFSHPFIIEVAV